MSTKDRVFEGIDEIVDAIAELGGPRISNQMIARRLRSGLWPAKAVRVQGEGRRRRYSALLCDLRQAVEEWLDQVAALPTCAKGRSTR